MREAISIFWHRRDLRTEDNAGMYKALSGNQPVLPIFIFDTNILSKLHERDARVVFIHKELQKLKKYYQNKGSDLRVFFDTPENAFEQLCSAFNVRSVYTNRDYEPYARQRDENMHEWFGSKGIAFIGAKDHVIFEKREILKDNGDPYTVFTPYSKKWKNHLAADTFAPFPSENLENFHAIQPEELIKLNDLGFEAFEPQFPEKNITPDLLEVYKDKRDIPSVKGTSRLSVHLRFGTMSIRSLAKKGQKHSESWLNELIWRDFYQMIIFHFPKSIDHEFKSKYAKIPWSKNMGHFEKWTEGKTGYPMVDAGMRELNTTGFMHNRVRMVVASFLTKHLLLDWRLGERYFAEKLLDFELASNVGGWQWAAGSGCDAAPYFRVFNPESQLKKFDPEHRYVKKWVPEYGTSSYPEPIVDHKWARQRAIDTYKKALSS